MRRILTHHKSLLGLTMFFKVSLGLSYIFLPIVFQTIIDGVVSGNIRNYKMACFMALGYIVLLALVEYFNRIAQAKYMEKTIGFLKQKMFDGILRMEYTDFQKENTSTYISNFTNDITQINTKYIGPLLESFGLVVIMVGSGVALFCYNVVVFLSILVLSVVILMLPTFFGNYLAKRQGLYSDGMARFTSKLKDYFSGFEVIATYSMRSRISKAFEKPNKEAEYLNFKSVEAISRLNSSAVYLGIMTRAAAYIAGGYFVLKGNLTIASLFAILELSSNLVTPFEELSDKFAMITSMREVKEKLIRFTKIEPMKKTQKEYPDFHKNICMEQVSFSYLEEEPILKDVDLTFEKNKKYLIVGESGSGKSTVIKLLMQYYQVNGGKIYMDGVDFSELCKDYLYEQFGVIHQNVYLFEDTLLENITLGRDYTQKELEVALAQSGVDRFLNTLTNGLEESMKDNGDRLSGGQRQRISIARALLKKKPILLLDEATSSLDAKTSYDIEKTLLHLPDTTIIAVSHKFYDELLQNYDQIIVLDHGKVVEKGTFAKLLAKNGFFYQLYYSGKEEKNEAANS